MKHFCESSQPPLHLFYKKLMNFNQIVNKKTSGCVTIRAHDDVRKACKAKPAKVQPNTIDMYGKIRNQTKHAHMMYATRERKRESVCVYEH